MVGGVLFSLYLLGLQAMVYFDVYAPLQSAIVQTLISVFMVHTIQAKRRLHFLATVFLLIIGLLLDFIRIFDAVNPTQGIVHAFLGDGSVLDCLQYSVVCGLEVLRRIDHVAP